MKEKIQKRVDELSDLCLMESELHHEYTDRDLVNSTIIFAHFVFDAQYSRIKKLPFKKQKELATKFGRDLRNLILKSTGKDLHAIVKN